jgi:hypothetical protein
MPIILSPANPSLIVPRVTVPLVSPITTVQLSPIIPSYLRVTYDSGMNDNWIVQKQASDYLYYRILDHWVHKHAFHSVLKFMTVANRKVKVVKSEEEYNKNDVSNDSMDDRELKADFIEENILSKEKMKKILIDIMNELQLKWQYLTQPKTESIVVDVTKKYLKKKLREMM